MSPNVSAGKASPANLQKWLLSKDLKNILSDINAKTKIHSLIEYVHRFAFVDFAKFLDDIDKKEVEKYSLKGRIFWAHGQIEWRRISENIISLLIITDDGAWNSPPDDFKPTNTRLDADDKQERNLILWGTYNSDEKAYLELRVAGSQPIQYPDEIISSGRDFPVLRIREYLNEDGETVLWRFMTPASISMNQSSKTCRKEGA